MIFRWPMAAVFLVLNFFTVAVHADSCRLESQASVDTLHKLMDGVAMLVSVCPHCQKNEPIPLRVKTYALIHTAPESVQLALYSRPTFPVRALEQAEQDGTGPLADALREAIEREYANQTGYPPDDPVLIEEKKLRYAMLLRFAREDVAMRTWDELHINGQPVNPALLYYPVGGQRYRSLGAAVGCELYSRAPRELTFTPVNRDPAREAPPGVYIADVTHQCYDGSCPLPEWTVARPADYYDAPQGRVQGQLAVDEVLQPVQTLSYIHGGRAVATQDHDHIFAGDVFYVLDSLAEGYYRFWHYGNVFIDDSSGIKHPKWWNDCVREKNCWAELHTLPESVWWSKVRRANGDAVWVKEPLDSLHGVLVD